MRITKRTLGLLLESYVQQANVRDSYADVDNPVPARLRAEVGCTAIAEYLWELITEGNEDKE